MGDSGSTDPRDGIKTRTTAGRSGWFPRLPLRFRSEFGRVTPLQAAQAFIPLSLAHGDGVASHAYNEKSGIELDNLGI